MLPYNSNNKNKQSYVETLENREVTFVEFLSFLFFFLSSLLVMYTVLELLALVVLFFSCGSAAVLLCINDRRIKCKPCELHSLSLMTAQITAPTV